MAKYLTLKMLNIKSNQTGFIPMLIIFLLVILAVIYLAFTQVINHQK